MWEDAAFSQDLFYVMQDPATWVLALVAVVGFRRTHPVGRLALALFGSAIFSFIMFVLPAGESGKPYAWKALLFELMATGVWTLLLLGLGWLFLRNFVMPRT